MTARLPGGLRPRLHLSIETSTGDVALSEADARLLRAVAEYGTLVAAARMLAMPHRTAWKRMREMEQRLDLRLAVTVSGGATGGSSRLTPEGRELLDRYFSTVSGLDAMVASRWTEAQRSSVARRTRTARTATRPRSRKGSPGKP